MYQRVKFRDQGEHISFSPEQKWWAVSKDGKWWEMNISWQEHEFASKNARLVPKKANFLIWGQITEWKTIFFAWPYGAVYSWQETYLLEF